MTRVLGIETSGLVGSVALSEAGRIVCSFEHSAPSRHAEETLGLIDRALAEAGFLKSSLDLIAAGTGPGSFTGVRVGLAVALGLSLGLDLPRVGVGSLLALAFPDGIPPEAELTAGATAPIRFAVRDARRKEYFIALYSARGKELVAPYAIAQEELGRVLDELSVRRPFLVNGSDIRSLTLEQNETVVAHARATALLGPGLDPQLHRLEPNYVRGHGAHLPNLPPSPFAAEP